MNIPVAGPSLVANLSDEEWLTLLSSSIDSPEVSGMRFPLFPPEETQRNFVGLSGRDALAEAVRFVRYAVDVMGAVGSSPADASCVVDFGAGWGRITRALLRYVDPERILAVDPVESMVGACRGWFEPSPVRFETTGTWPPLSTAPNSVDLIVAYSVFSHLPLQLATAWMAEFRRVLKPGGLVVATTQSRSFIDLCEQMRTDPQYTSSDFLWYQLLAKSFVDPVDARRRFDAGEFLHEANGGGDVLLDSTYGDSLFGPGFVLERWGHLLDPVRFDDKPYELPQACFVLRKGAVGSSGVASVELGDLGQAAAFERQLRAIKASWTWRVGRAVLAPVRGARTVRGITVERLSRTERPGGS